MALKTRKPTGRVPWPLILVEGGEKAGKSWMCAELSASDKVGQTYWIDFSEGSGDEYGAIPGARYEIVEHDGTFGALLTNVIEIKALAQKAADAGEPPVVLVLDTATAEWDLLKGIADTKARDRLAKKGRRLPPDAEPTISMDLWNDVNGLHRKLMTHLMTFPGIALVTARGKWVAAIDDNGRPIEGRKEYRVEAQKGLAYDASVWVRVSRDHPPTVIGCRSVHAGIQPGVDKPKEVPGLTLEQVVFDVLKCDPKTAHVRDLVELQPTVDPTPDTQPAAPPAAPASQQVNGQAPPSREEVMTKARAAIANAADDAALAAIKERAGQRLAEGVITADDVAELQAAVKAREEELQAGEEAPTGPGPAEAQHRKMHALWPQVGLGGDDNRWNRLTQTSMLIGRDVQTSKELTPAEADRVIAWLEAETNKRAANGAKEGAAV